jgi:hypothetical protein
MNTINICFGVFVVLISMVALFRLYRIRMAQPHIAGHRSQTICSSRGSIYGTVESTLLALWKATMGRMKSRSGSSLFILSPPFGMRMIAKPFSLAGGVVLMLLNEAAGLCSRAMPRCIHSENSYSFPRTFAGKTTRTCCKCGHRRAYDMATMHFVTGRFVSTS